MWISGFLFNCFDWNSIFIALTDVICVFYYRLTLAVWCSVINKQSCYQTKRVESGWTRIGRWKYCPKSRLYACHHTKWAASGKHNRVVIRVGSRGTSTESVSKTWDMLWPRCLWLNWKWTWIPHLVTYKLPQCKHARTARTRNDVIGRQYEDVHPI